MFVYIHIVREYFRFFKLVVLLYYIKDKIIKYRQNKQNFCVIYLFLEHVSTEMDYIHAKNCFKTHKYVYKISLSLLTEIAATKIQKIQFAMSDVLLNVS